MIKNLNLEKFFKCIISFIFVYFNLFFKKKRFIPINFPFFKKQKFYDREKKIFFNIFILTWEDFITLKQIFYHEEYNLKRLKRFKDIKNYLDLNKSNNKKNLILDCGGNIGLASKYFDLNIDNKKIICIEPEKNNLELSKKNNNSDIDFLNCAVGSQNTSGNIIDPGLGNFAYRITEKSNESGQSVEIVTINRLISKYTDNNTLPFLIKIDIEGFEKNLFQENLEWIEKFPVIIIEIHDWMMPKQNISSNFLKAISKHERDFIFIGENIYSISNKI